MAVDVSCHSFVRMARLAVPLMTEGGSLSTLTYLGATRVSGRRVECTAADMLQAYFAFRALVTLAR